MGNLRTIKKDIDFLISEVISDSYMHLYFNGSKQAGEVEAILSDAVGLRNELFARVNAKPTTEKVKQHYTAISRDLLVGVDALFQRISGLRNA